MANRNMFMSALIGMGFFLVLPFPFTEGKKIFGCDLKYRGNSEKNEKTGEAQG